MCLLGSVYEGAREEVCLIVVVAIGEIYGVVEVYDWIG